MNRISISGEISSWGYSARWLKNELSELSGDIEVEISSYGGDVFEGVDMYNELRKYSKEKGHVTTVNKSKAMSIASLLFLGGDTKKAYSNATIMIHKAWTWMAGNADDLIKEAKVLDSIDNVLVTTYSKYMKKDKEYIKSILKDEGWYIGKEQMESTGFVDEFIDDEIDENLDLAMAKKNFANKVEEFKIKAKEENAKPDLEIAARAIAEVSNLATMPSDNEKIANLIKGESMEFNETNFKVLQVRLATRDEKITLMEAEKELLETKVAKMQDTLDNKTTEFEKEKSNLENKLSEAEAGMENYKNVVTTRLSEAKATGVDMDTALAMLDAETDEDASKIALDSKSNTSALNQGEGEPSEKSAILAWAEQNKGSIR